MNGSSSRIFEKNVEKNTQGKLSLTFNPLVMRFRTFDETQFFTEAEKLGWQQACVLGPDSAVLLDNARRSYRVTAEVDKNGQFQRLHF